MSILGVRVPRVFTALAALLLLVGCGPSDPIAEVRDLLAEGRSEDSLEPLQELLEERPDDAEIQYLYGHALILTKQLSLAQFALRSAMKDPEWLVPAGLELASATLLTGDFEEAIDATNGILETEPEHLEALLLRSRALVMSRHRYPEALADAERALELDPESVEARMLRSVSLLGLERIDEAEVAIAELDRVAREAELEPNDAARFCGMRAVFAKEKGDPDAAERIFGECLALFPVEPVLLQEAIEFFDERRQPRRSVEILRNALAEQPSASAYRRALATRLAQAGDVAEAERILREGTEMANPVLSAEAWVDLGNHYHALEDYASAASALGKALEITGSDDPHLVFDYADALVMAGRYDEALEIASRMSVPAYRALVQGRVELEQGHPTAALERFGEALRLWPDNAVARYYAALAAEGAGDFDRAIAEYRYAIRADADLADARLRLARLHLAEGAGDRALAALRHAASRSPTALEADLLDLRLAARAGRMGAVRSRLAKLSAEPQVLGRAVVAAAEGVRERRGPAAAAAFVQGVPHLDLTDPENSAALRVLVADLAAAGQTGAALAAARSALERHPDVAGFHAVHASALEASGAPAEEVRAAHDRTLKLDPGSAAALAGLARLAAGAGSASTALDLYAKAAAADTDDASALRASAELLVALDRGDEADRQLEKALARSPYDGAIALRLAELLIERSGDPDRVLSLARRAARFGGGPAADALVSRAQELQGGSTLAKQGPAVAPDATPAERADRPGP